MSEDDHEAKMQSMMSQFFGGMAAAEKNEMCATMMAKMKQGGQEGPMSHMPEMMLGTMMPHCIGMMLPTLDPDKRGEAAAAILSAIVEKGSAGMSEQQAEDFRKALHEAMDAAA